MARVQGKLTSLKVERAKTPGLHGDGGGLYLRLTEDGTKSWVYRFMLNGRPRWMGLGPLSLFGLQEARGKALDARRLRHEGVDPIDARRTSRAQERLETAKALSFTQCSEAYVKAHRAGWRNAKHATQWESTLATYAKPIIGALPVQAIDTGLLLKVLEPIWTDKPETASRVRQRIERVLDWARVRGYRTGENPARWKGHLDQLLPARAKVRRVVHHAALPYGDLPAFLVELREQEGIAARALEYLVLTAGRSGEVFCAAWPEINSNDKIWVISGERMKAGREHRVPLSARALAILEEMYKLRHADDGFVFPGAKPGKPLSNMAFLMLLRRMGRDDLTAHGFRSSFRDWAAERTNFPAAVAELALAHSPKDATVAAYNRSDLFERRRRLMQQWATYCTTPPQEKRGSVTALRR
jgi:integrase